MKSAMDAYPEYVGIDATFKLLNIRAPVYLMIVEDPNGCTEIVGVSILINENKVSLEWMMDSFKKCHPSWEKIKCVMTDKDLTERDAIRSSLLPVEVNLIMCAFHTLRTFNREITTEKRRITPTERDEAKRILQQMVYAETEDRYNELYDELRRLPKSILDYFNENWHDCRNEWSLSSDYMQHNFGNDTNNRLESINAKIKKDLDRFMSLEEFIKQFLTFLECSQRERDHKAASDYQKRKVLSYSKNSPENCYANYLTNYAFKFIIKEFNKIDHLELEYNDKLNIYEEIISPTVKVSSTSTSCSCLERTSMNLPCRHILLVRKIEKKNLFEETLCNERWTRNYYFETQRVFKSSDEQIPVPESIISSIEYKKKILSENEKFRKANEIAKKLPSLAAEVGTKLFTSRFKVLVDLLEAWQNNEEVEIIKITNRNKQKINNSRLSRINLHHDSNNSNNNENDTIIEDSDCDNNNNNFNNNNNNNNDDDNSEMLNQLESSKSSDHEFIDNNTTGGLDYHDVPETNLLKIKVINEKSTRKNYDLQRDSSNDDSESMKIMVHEPPQPNNNYADSSDDDEDDIDRYLKLKRHKNLLPDSSEDDDQMINKNDELKENEINLNTLDRCKDNSLNKSPLENRVSTMPKILNETKTSSTIRKDINVLSNIIVQPSLKRRGRPKGTDKTVIGLPRKVKRAKKEKEIPFIEKSSIEKSKIILKWLMPRNNIDEILNNQRRISESDVTISINELSFAIIDDKNINLSSIKQYFTNEGWEKVNHLCDQKKKIEWQCKYCKIDLNKTVDNDDDNDGGDDIDEIKKFKISIGCDYCLEWYHLKCAGLVKKPKYRLWMCAGCKSTR
ncbi:MATH and LRR domain-containing protein PFE0570w-like [Microplitis mediator]|uniref:MATH and LRR domain-containing protein PFE0570w-like n=1 Tax=Microplitis mediator TaxID=375433 RepID=UPI0025548863|nr:MATH and LRR domain-containing protein PFE0570w-like [Microplitis mediator]XP_057336090.1 MATH and LRR domain-containing protein PFE0570w-like [Microplitis mediator]